jgi:proprotein convertase subtilisin/kexin type 5
VRVESTTGSLEGECIPQLNCDTNNGYITEFSSQLRCFKCDSSCKTCDSKLDTESCSSCTDQNKVLEKLYPAEIIGKCVENCRNSFYPDAQKICQPCPIGCSSCTITACNSCSGLYFLKNGICVLNCGDGYFSSTNLCNPCLTNCRVCTLLLIKCVIL